MKPHRVTAFEDVKRGNVVHLRWIVDGKRTVRSMGFTVRGPRGGIDRDLATRVEQAAAEQHLALVRGSVALPISAERLANPLTIAEGWARASDPDTGKWNKATQYRDDIQRAIDAAVASWGPSMTWDAVDRGQLRKLWRNELAKHRAAGHKGVRGSELTLDLVLAVGAWLRDEQLVAPTAALRWKGMDAEFKADADPDGEYAPSRPRYTVDEYRAMFATSWEADERYGLAYNLGAEYRLGKVVQARRSHLNLPFGQLRVLGRGKKKGATIVLTPGQLRDVKRVLTTGYLAGLETAYLAQEIEDYCLFPAGHFAHDAHGRLLSRADYAARGPIDRTAVRAWHRETERLAGIEHLKGRGPYGSRRAGVDAAKAAQISREGLQAHGGWADSQMPDAVYADAEAGYARDEAAEVRARIRGESLVKPEESSQIVTPSDDATAPSTSL